MMIAEINQPLEKGARCPNCKGDLVGSVVDTTKGKQAQYYCPSDNCPKAGLFTARYLPALAGGKGPK